MKYFVVKRVMEVHGNQKDGGFILYLCELLGFFVCARVWLTRKLEPLAL